MIDSIIPELLVGDMKKSFRFYGDVLGFEKFMSVPDTSDGDYAWVWLKRGEAQIMLESREEAVAEIPHLKDERAGSVILFLSVTEIEDLHTKLKSEVDLISDLRTTNYGSREFFIKDPDGYTLIFSQRN